MSRPIVARATSLAASTGVLALLIAGALSVSYVVRTVMPGDGPTPVVMENPYVPPPPVPHPTQPQPHPRDVIDDHATPAHTQDPPVEPTKPISFEPPTDTGPPTISNPHWLQVPRDLTRYYPNRAQQMSVEGSATLDCLVDTGGRLGCTVVAETPAGWNFGSAALRISRDYRMAPATQNGQAVQGHYRMRVPFQIPQH
ncbi:MAG: TonB family protein [Terricaulis sp.]